MRDSRSCGQSDSHVYVLEGCGINLTAKIQNKTKKPRTLISPCFLIFKALVLLMQNSESSAKNILILVEFARAMEKELGEISQDAFVEYSLRVG